MQKNVFQSQFVHCYWFLILVKYVIIFIVSAFLAQCTSVLDASSCNRKWSVNAFYYSLWHHLAELIKIKFIAIERPRPAAGTWVAIIVHNRDNYLPCRGVKLCREPRHGDILPKLLDSCCKSFHPRTFIYKAFENVANTEQSNTRDTIHGHSEQRADQYTEHVCVSHHVKYRVYLWVNICQHDTVEQYRNKYV